MSTGYGRDNGWIAVHRYRGTPYEEYFHGVEAITCDDGRPHRGKPHFRDADSLGPTCPEWDAAMAVRSRLDPDGVSATRAPIGSSPDPHLGLTPIVA